MQTSRTMPAVDPRNAPIRNSLAKSELRFIIRLLQAEVKNAAEFKTRMKIAYT